MDVIAFWKCARVVRSETSVPTTLNEYQKYFEKDKALERRFQTVMVNEPDG